MKHAIDTVGQWFLLEDTRERFQVIEEDELSGTIRVQWFDGSLDEIELETWRVGSCPGRRPGGLDWSLGS